MLTEINGAGHEYHGRRCVGLGDTAWRREGARSRPVASRRCAEGSLRDTLVGSAICSRKSTVAVRRCVYRPMNVEGVASRSFSSRWHSHRGCYHRSARCDCGSVPQRGRQKVRRSLASTRPVQPGITHRIGVVRGHLPHPASSARWLPRSRTRRALPRPPRTRRLLPGLAMHRGS